MYKQPELKEYQDEWIQAERDLAINSMGILGLFPIPPDEFTPSQSSSEPTGIPKQNKDADHLTKSDFIKALSKVSRHIEKPKSSPKSS